VAPIFVQQNKNQPIIKFAQIMLVFIIFIIGILRFLSKNIYRS